MKKIILYRFTREDGGVTVSPNKTDKENFEILYRLIADEGKILTKDGINTTPCTDEESSDGWYEIDDAESELPEGAKILGGNTEAEKEQAEKETEIIGDE